MSSHDGRLVPTRAVLYRGGTSRALVVYTPDLPTLDPDELRDWLLAVYGSPDAREIDGIGGADILTSKFAHAARSERDDADLDYTFIQVSVDQPSGSYQILCGNISSCIAPWAIDEGLVEAVEPVTTVRVFNTNIQRIFTAEVEVENGRPKAYGDTHIDGVPGTAAPIHMDFSETTGGRTGSLLPTGNVIDTMNVPEAGEIEYSLVDISGVQAFMRASDFGLTGTEDPVELEGMRETLAKVERARSILAHRLGFATSIERATVESPASPFAILVGPPVDREAFGTGDRVPADDNDFVAVMTTAMRVHKAFPGTGAIPTAVAACIHGSLVDQVSRPIEGDRIRIGHPSGVWAVTASVDQNGADVTVTKAKYVRTARRIMEGNVFADSARVPWLGSAQSHHVPFAPLDEHAEASLHVEAALAS